MRVLLAHNRYLQRGGEDLVFEAEARLLEQRGDEVVRYEVSNDDLPQETWRLARDLVWNPSSYRELRAVLRDRAPDVVHVHNTFPLISPAVYYAARDEGIPVVQTLHNYRLVCPGATLSRDGRACVECVGHTFAWPALRHGCYRKSRAATTAVAGTVALHRALGTWRNLVSTYVCMSEWARDLFVRGGLPAKRLVVKPNFIDPDPGLGDHGGGYALFVGRLAEEKGVRTLLEAWTHLGGAIPLVIVGDGPLAADVKRAAETIRGVSWLGRRPSLDVQELMKEARFLVCPSVCAEGCPLVVAEAYATGLPVLASRIGSLGTMVVPGRTGALADPGDASDLAASAMDLAHGTERVAELIRGARAEFLARFSADAHYESISAIYRRAERGVVAP